MDNSETAATEEARGAETVLVLTRRFAASPERLFRAWTESADLTKWWGPKGMTPVIDRLDVRIGGTYRTGMLAPDGSEHWVGGSYREVSPPNRLVFTWAWEGDGMGDAETLVTIDFRPLDGGDGTEMTLTHDLLSSQNSRKLHTEGWESSFECLAELF